MKVLLVIFAFLISSKSFADVVVINRADDPALVENYIEATSNAIVLAGKEVCKFGSEDDQQWGVIKWLRMTKIVSVTSGVQPLLTFDSGKVYADGFQRALVSVTTSSDYQKVIQVEVQAFNSVRVNAGNLKNPKMVDGWSVIEKFSCRN